MAKPPGALSPFVFWAQTGDKVSLKVDLKEVKDPVIIFLSKSLKFKGFGRGAKGVDDYEFSIDLFGKVNTKKCSFKITDRQIDISLPKDEISEWWPRLTDSPTKFQWLKIDFDKWKSMEDNEADSEPDYQEQVRQLSRDILGEKDPQEDWKRNPGRIESFQLYMFLYNMAQFVCYLIIFLRIVVNLAMSGSQFIPQAYATVGPQMLVCQTAAFLEIVHPLLGYVKTGVKTPLAQVVGRGVCLFLLIAAEPRMQPKPVVAYLFLIWSSVEIIRYPFYMFSVMQKSYGLLTWLRYTAWIPLYPLGFICEGIVMLRSIPFLMESHKPFFYVGEIPIGWHHLLMVYMVIYIPGALMLIHHMYRQRRKRLMPTRFLKKKAFANKQKEN